MSDQESPCVLSISLDPRLRWMGVLAFGFSTLLFILVLLFETTVCSRVDSFSKIARESLVQANGALTVQKRHTAQNLSEFIEWRSSSFLLIGAVVAAIVISCWSVWCAFKVDRKATSYLVAMALPAGLAFAWLSTSGEQSVSFLSQAALAAQNTNEAAKGIDLFTLVMAPKRIGELVAGLVGLGIAAVLILPSELTARRAISHIRRLRMLMFASASMLVVGVLLTRSAFTWVLSYIPISSDAGMTGAHLGSIAGAATKLAASSYTLLLASTYLPAAMMLNHLSRKIAVASIAEESVSEVEAWLDANGLKLKWQSQAARLAVLMSPMLSASIPGLAGLGS